MTQSWGTNHAPSVTISGAGNLTASTTLNSSFEMGAASEGAATGTRLYFEIVITGTDAIGVGFLGTGDVFGDGNYVGQRSMEVGLYSLSGTVYNNGSSSQPFGTFSFASGTAVGIALDLVANLAWFRPGPGANWNNDVIGNQNPAVGSQVGGYAIPSAVTSALPIYPAYCLNNSTAGTGSNAVGQFASSSWSAAAPSGFSPFDPSVGCTIHTLATMGVGCSISMIGWTPALLRSPLPLLGGAAVRLGGALRRNATVSRRSLLIGHNNGPTLDD